MKARDKRTGLMNEILQGIRMLKQATSIGPAQSELTDRFMAWERSFEKRVNVIRKDELHWQARNYQIEVGFNMLYETTPILVTVVAFLVSFHPFIPSAKANRLALHLDSWKDPFPIDRFHLDRCL